MTSMTRFDPLDGVASLHDEVDRLLRAASGSTAQWSPLMDVAESEDAYQLVLELPGVRRDDVTITLEDGVLAITGERRREEVDGIQMRRIERRHGAFHRSIRLPERIDPDGVEATFADGLLTISVAKAEEARPRTIEIRSA